jgi:hypothetical protein
MLPYYGTGQGEHDSFEYYPMTTPFLALAAITSLRACRKAALRVAIAISLD